MKYIFSMQRCFKTNKGLINGTSRQASAYEAGDRTRTPLHMPKTLQTGKKARHVWFNKLQGVRQIAHLKQLLFIFHFLCNTKILRENHVYLFLFHWFSAENCVIFLFSLLRKNYKETWMMEQSFFWRLY